MTDQIAAQAPPFNAAPKPRVIIYAPHLLPWSQTFIRAQALALRDWKPILAGEKLEPKGLPLNSLEHTTLTPTEAGNLNRWMYVTCRLARVAHPPSVRALRALQASLFHTHFGTAAVDVWPLVKALKLPMLITLHGADINTHRGWWESGRGGWRRRRYPAQLIELSQHKRVHFIAVSQAIQRRAIEFGIPKDKVTLSYIGVDTSFFVPSGPPITERKNRILFVGRLVPNKGLTTLFDAIARVKKYVPNTELLVLGDGPQRAQLESLSASMKVDAKFLGVASDAEVQAQMGFAKILCQPSETIENGESEALGIAILEAQSCGLPVISSARGGATEGIIPGVTGFSFEERDAEALAQRILMLFSNQEILQSASNSAIRFAQEKFNISTCTKTLESIYEQVSQRL